MLIGTANVAELAKSAPTIDRFLEAPVALSGAAWFQMTAEMRNAAREAVLPPSLHPTVPAVLSLQAASVRDSPWGPYAMAFVRIGCRSGVRARGFSTGMIVSTERACAGLRDTFGFPARIGDVRVRHGYSGVEVVVIASGKRVLDVSALDAEPMSAEDVQYTGTLNLAHTPRGVRLVQVEIEHTSRQVERLKPKLDAFDGAAWGNALLDPYFPVSASLALGDVVIPPVRFVCRPDELAFTGTEVVSN
jgi:hypothetical protein